MAGAGGGTTGLAARVAAGVTGTAVVVATAAGLNATAVTVAFVASVAAAVALEVVAQRTGLAARVAALEAAKDAVATRGEVEALERRLTVVENRTSPTGRR